MNSIEKTYEKLTKDNGKFWETAGLDFVKKEVNKLPSIDYCPNGRTTTIFMVACRKTPSIEVIQWLLDSGADVNWEGEYYEIQPKPLTFAAENKSDNALKIVKLLINAGADVNGTDLVCHSPTPLMSASGNSSDNALEIVKLLINKGADVNAVCGFQRTPLIYAAAENSGDDSLEIVKLLINKGADVNGPGDGNNTALDSMDPDDESNTEKIKLLKEHGGRYIFNSKLLNTEWATNVTPEKLIEEIENGANVNDFKRFERVTPLMIFAEFNNNPECLEILLEHGANINDQEKSNGIGVGKGKLYGKTYTGPTALMKAAKSGQIDNMSLLLKKGADQFLRTSDGENALSFASDIDSVILLLEHGLDVNETTAKGITVLMSLSGLKNDPKSLRTLIEKYGANVNDISSYGGTALMQAAKNGHIDNVNLLLEKGAEKSIRTPKAETALNLAKKQGHFDVYKKLSEDDTLEKGAEKSINTPKGETALSFAKQDEKSSKMEKVSDSNMIMEKKLDFSLNKLDKAINKASYEIYNSDYWKNENSASILESISYVNDFNETSDGWSILMLASLNTSDPAIIFTLVSKGADINYKNNESTYGETVLMIACINNENSKVIKALISLGADVNEINNTGDNALMLAIEYNSHSDIIISLADETEDLNAQNDDGDTALILAIENNVSYSEISFLINKGADIGIKNYDQKTALDIAKELNVSEDIMLLLDPDFKKSNDKIKEFKGKVSFVTKDLDEHFPKKGPDSVLLKNFGEKFWDLLFENSDFEKWIENNEIEKIQYEDHWICRPIEAILLRKIFDFMNDSTKINSSHTELIVKTGYKKFRDKEKNRGCNISHQWNAKESEYINNLTEILDMPEDNISFKLSEKKEHDRYLKIFAKDSKKYYRIAIGQGLSEFRINDKEINHFTPEYDFENSKLMVEIKKMKFVVYANNKAHSLSVELRDVE